MKKLITLFFILFLCTTWSFAQCTATVGSSCTLTAAGTITVPEGVTMIEVKAWGAGGGSESPGSNKRSGGGGGAYYSFIYTVTTGQTVTATAIGQGAPGMDGGNTVFTDPGGTLITVNGGEAGNTSPGAGGAAGAGPGHVAGGNGGAREGSGGDGGGGGGGSGPGATAGMNGSGGVGGAGGMAGGGASGGAGGASGVSGSNGIAPGGGGGGQGNNSGGSPSAGANGQVTVCVVGILPVELVSFNANVKDNQTLLEWQTASEKNNRGFEIQKSKDGIAWDILEFVEGKGTSYGLNTYTFIDKLPTKGLNYYRLKQLDFDGRFDYSKIVVVDFNLLNEVEMFPNPVKDQLTLVNVEGEVTIYDVLGQAVKHLKIDAEQSTIQLSDLLKGQYYLQVLQTDGTILTKQFAKVN